MGKLIANIWHHFLNYFKYQLCRAIIGNIMETHKKFNTRAFIAVGMFLSFIGLPFSGIMNHILGFESLTVQRHVWMSVHNILGFFFLIFSVCHIVLNRKSLMRSIKNVTDVIISREALYAVSLILFFLTLLIFHAVHVR
jgi:hypothetical protein